MSKQRFSLSSWQELISLFVLMAIATITILAYFTSYYGWKIYLEILSHFQVQYFLLSLVLLTVLIFLRCRRQIYIGIFFCAILSAQILPWFLPSYSLLSANQESDLKVLVANVNTQNTSYNKVIDLVKAEKPDLAIFTEVDKKWQAQLDTLEDLLPYSSGQCSSCNLGILLYTNQPLKDSKIEFLGAENNSSLVAQLIVKQQPVTVVATHPYPPLKPSFFASRNQQIFSIGKYITEIDNRVILAGDFNMSMWSPYSRKLIDTTNLDDSRRGFGIIPSWPTPNTYKQLPGWLSSVLRIPIDRCLISQGFKTTSIHTGGQIDSDHLPLIVGLQIADFD